MKQSKHREYSPNWKTLETNKVQRNSYCSFTEKMWNYVWKGQNGCMLNAQNRSLNHSKHNLIVVFYTVWPVSIHRCAVLCNEYSMVLHQLSRQCTCIFINKLKLLLQANKKKTNQFRPNFTWIFSRVFCVAKFYVTPMTTFLCVGRSILHVIWPLCAVHLYSRRRNIFGAQIRSK